MINHLIAFDVNCTSQYFVAAAFLPLLAKAASGPTGRVGSVINNSSVGGILRMSVQILELHRQM